MSIPSCTSNGQLCTKCYSTQNPSNTCTSSSSQNSSSNEQPCSAYCNTGCNSSCNRAQTYCNLGYQLITSIVGNFPIKEVCGASNETCGYSQYDIIGETWTATNWNSIISKIATAERAGTYGRGNYNAPTPTRASSTQSDENNIITAEKYNQIVKKINQFNSSLSTVNVDNVITATRANALRTGFNNAKFSSSLCDVCNVGSENVGGACGCNCSCACACNCGCSCPCNCSCTCGPSCSCPETPTATT